MNAGLTEDEFVSVVSVSAFALDFATEDGGRDRSARLEGRLRRVWNKADDGWQPPFGSSETLLVKLEELSHRADVYGWPSRTARTDRAVALALIAWAHEIGVWTLAAGTRELSLRAGVAHGTAKRALGRLATAGLIRKDDQDRAENHTQRWVLNLGWGFKCTSDPLGLQHGGKGPSGLNTPLNHPAFLHTALGQNAGRIWLDIGAHPGTTAADAAERLGLKRQVVSRTLNEKLCAHGLVVKTAGTGTGRRGRPAATFALNDDGPTLDEVAEAFGVADWFERTAERYNRERGGHRELQRQLNEDTEADKRQREEHEQLLRQQTGMTA